MINAEEAYKKTLENIKETDNTLENNGFYKMLKNEIQKRINISISKNSFKCHLKIISVQDEGHNFLSFDEIFLTRYFQQSIFRHLKNLGYVVEHISGGTYLGKFYDNYIISWMEG